MAKEYIFQRTQHGLVTDGDCYLRSIAVGVKRAFLRGYVVISSCADQTDFAAHPPLVTFTFYCRDSVGSTWGDFRYLDRDALTLSNWDCSGTLMCYYKAKTDFIIFDMKGGSYTINYMLNGWTTRQELQVAWILESDDTASD